MTTLEPKDKILVDVNASRNIAIWTKKELLGRLLWEVSSPILFRLSIRQFWSWRNMLLRIYGAKIGQNVRIHPSVKITVPWKLTIGDNVGIGDGAILYSLGHITIQDSATISQYAHLCAGSHDHREKSFNLTKNDILIGAGAWICADAFVGPDVEVGNHAIVGARAVVVQNVEPSSIIAGNPATLIRHRDTA